MISLVRCRAKNPVTCREHGGTIARNLLLPGTIDRDFGLPAAALQRYETSSRDLARRMDDDEEDSLRYYTGFGYSYVNGWLRSGLEGMIDAEIHDVYRHVNTPVNRAKARGSMEALIPRMQAEVAHLDSAFAKSDKYASPRVLYKAFRVRSETGGDTTSAAEIKEYVAQHYRVGNIVRNKAYTSTSLDPDYMLVHARRRASQVIVHEIVTDKGLPLHRADTGSIQSSEREMLLPRDTKLQIVKITRARFAHSGLGPDMGHWGLQVPQQKRFTVVQFREVE